MFIFNRNYKHSVMFPLLMTSNLLGSNTIYYRNIRSDSKKNKIQHPEITMNINIGSICFQNSSYTQLYMTYTLQYFSNSHQNSENIVFFLFFEKYFHAGKCPSMIF